MRMGNGSIWIARMWSSENESSEMMTGNGSTWIATVGCGVVRMRAQRWGWGMAQLG